MYLSSGQVSVRCLLFLYAGIRLCVCAHGYLPSSFISNTHRRRDKGEERMQIRDLRL